MQTVKDPRIEVLVIGQQHGGFSPLRNFLEARGCRCLFANSVAECICPRNSRPFQLILNTMPGLLNLAALAPLGSDHCHIFAAYAVENGCWWLPLMRRGEKCLGSPALRPKQFIAALEETLKDIVASLQVNRSHAAAGAA